MNGYSLVFVVALALFLSFQCEEPAQFSVIDDKVELGHYLFFDKDLSFNNRTSCATCHDPEVAFTDSYRRAFNYRAEKLKTNTPSVLNLQDYPYFSWSDSSVSDLHIQMRRPLFSHSPIEIGMDIDSLNTYSTLESKYGNAFALLYGQVNSKHIIDAIAKYINRLQSRNSAFDRMKHGWGKNMMSADAKKGWNLFQAMSCTRCHGNRDFNVSSKKINFSYAYRIPSLRNVMITSPYLHDGSAVTIKEVMRAHRLFLNSNTLGGTEEYRLPENKEELSQLVSFLTSLTDTTYLNNSLFLSPHNNNEWKAEY